MTEPWALRRRDEIKARIDAAAEVVADQLGADAVVIIALYREGDSNVHVQDGGKCPMPLSTLYKGLAQAHDTVDERGEGWVNN